MKNKTLGIGVAAFAIALGLGISGVASAHNAEFRGEKLPEEQRNQIHQAIQNMDFEAWKEAVPEDHKFADKMTQEKFEQMAERMKQGLEEGEPIRGHRNFMGKFKKNHKQGKRFSPEQREQMKNALESGDYNAWKELVPEKAEKLEVINEGNFAQFVEMHQLRKSGDKEGAKAIAAELGLQRPNKR